MLPYHPAFDSYHCAFRVLLLLERMNKPVVEVDKMRIWDFYFVFPQEIKNITFTQSLWALKKEFQVEPNPYDKLLDPKRIFERMKPFQIAALNHLAAYGFIDPKELSRNLVKRTDKPLPKELSPNMEKLDSQQQSVIKLLQSPFNDIKFLGPGGFKDRTKLLDARYDPT